MAGESASEVARRKREKAARLTRDAERWERGAAGEQTTAQALATLPASQWRVLHDVRWPSRRYANIDHVVVGPGGIFVIDSKNWSGRVDVRDGVLRQNGHSREREVAAVADSSLAVVEAMGGVVSNLVRPVLCLVTEEPVATQSHEVLVCSTATLVSQLVSQPVILHPVGVPRMFDEVSRILTSASGRAPQARQRSGRRSLVGRPDVPSLPSRRQSAGRSWRVARSCLALAAVGLVGLLAIGLVVEMVSSLASSVHLGGGSGLAAPREQGSASGAVRHLGDAQTFPRATGRPLLTVRVKRFTTTRVLSGRSAPYLFPGNRWVAIEVSIHNRGQRGWTSQPGTEWALSGDYGTGARSQGAIGTRAGRPLPDVMKVPAGKTVRGWVVFQTDASRPVTGVTLTVGPGQPSSASWVVDRQ